MTKPHNPPDSTSSSNFCLRSADGSVDDSAADFGAAAELLANEWPPGDVCAALSLASPNVDARHRDAREYRQELLPPQNALAATSFLCRDHAVERRKPSCAG
jgi:hypothetical protein